MQQLPVVSKFYVPSDIATIMLPLPRSFHRSGFYSTVKPVRSARPTRFTHARATYKPCETGNPFHESLSRITKRIDFE